MTRLALAPIRLLFILGGNLDGARERARLRPLPPLAQRPFLVPMHRRSEVSPGVYFAQITIIALCGVIGGDRDRLNAWAWSYRTARLLYEWGSRCRSHLAARRKVAPLTHGGVAQRLNPSKVGGHYYILLRL